jgi:Tfp pilus assembly protein PilF
VQSDLVREAIRCAKAGREEEAFALVQRRLREERDDIDALDMLGTLHARAEHYTPAWLIYRRMHELAPKRDDVMSNIGMALDGLERTSEAREWFMRAIKANPTKAAYPANVAMTYLRESNPRKTIEWANAALQLDPEQRSARTAHGFASLAIGDWSAGWDGYEAALDTAHRARRDFGLQEWRGETDGELVVYGEQGIGDEIMFASMFGELRDRMRPHSVTVECDARLARLFARSFPGVNVVGTRRAEPTWLQPSMKYQAPAGRLGTYLRPTPLACPGTPYLVPDPELKVMYRALIESYARGRRAVGITWSGGLQNTGASRRSPGLAAFAPIIRANPDVAWFSLEYKPETAREIEDSDLPVKHVHMAVGKGANYDHTAAFISCLDGVTGVDTAAHHCAGALGVPVLTLLHQRPLWLFGAYQNEHLVWYRNTRVFRPLDGEQWPQLVERLLTRYPNMLARLTKGTDE